MLVAVKWGAAGNENRQIDETMVARFKSLGYIVYEAEYRPGLYIKRRVFEETAKRVA